MASGQVSLSIALTGEDKLAAVIEKSNRAMGNFQKKSTETAKTTTTGFATMKAQISGIGTTFTELNSKLQLVKAAFQAVQAVGDAAISGEIANNAEKIFSQISGGAAQAEKVMQALRKTSRGLLDDTTIQQFAGSLRLAGVEFDQIQRVMAIATDVALATGQDLETVSRKIKDAALAGRQGEFDRLGVVVRVNEELKTRAEQEGKVVDEMTKNEQVTARLDILQEKLTQTMRAAGIETSQLSTNLRGLKTDLANLQSTGEQTLANLFTPEEMERIRGTVSRGVKRAIRDLSDVTVQAALDSKSTVESLALSLDLTEEEVRMALFKMSRNALQFGNQQEDIEQALADAVVKGAESRRKAEQERAKAAIEESNKAMTAKKEEVDFFVREEKALTAELELAKGQARDEHIQDLEMRLMSTKAYLAELRGATQEEIDQIFEIEEAKIRARDAAAEKEKTAKAERDKAERKRRSDNARRERERQQAEDAARAKETLRAMTEEGRVRRELEITLARESGDIQKAQNLERLNLAEKLREDLVLNSEQGFAQDELLKTQANAESVRMEIAHNKELEQIRQAAIDQQLRDAEDARQRAKEIRDQNLKEFQEEVQEYARATNLLMGPLTQLVDHQRGASEELKAFGATMGATSAAVNVYANETDASKSANDRFVQGLPAMTSASGMAAASFVKSTKNKAAIQGAFEAASSIAAFATGNVVGGAGHAAAAAMFFALAGKSGGGGAKGGAMGTKTGALAGGGGGSGMSAAGGTSQVTVNVQGFALGSAVDMGAAIGRTVDTARHTGLNSSEA